MLFSTQQRTAALVLLLLANAWMTACTSTTDPAPDADLVWGDFRGLDGTAPGDTTVTDQSSTPPDTTALPDDTTRTETVPSDSPEQPSDSADSSDAAVQEDDLTADETTPHDASQEELQADLGADLPFDADQEVVLPPTTWTGSYATAFSATLTGEGSGLVGKVAVDSNVGTLQVQGSAVSVIVTEQIEWDTNQGHYSLYQLLGPTSDNLYVAYVYCLGNVLNYVYIEGFDIPMSGEAASGVCKVAASPVTVNGSVAAMTELPAPPQPLAGVSLQGSMIDVTDGSGESSVAGGMEVTLFGYVDCLECPSSDGKGWLEFHSVLHNNFPSDVCFGIFYYYPSTSQVQLGWGFCLSSFTYLSGANLGTATLSM